MKMNKDNVKVIKYRQGKKEDAEHVAAVLLKNYNIKNLEEAKNAFLDDLKRFEFIIAEEGGKIIGISCWRIHGLPKHQVAECGRVAVLPEYQGKGIATALFEKVVHEADIYYKKKKTKLRKIYAYVHSSNKKAKEFYENLGLIKEAVLKDHYYKGEDEFVYSMFME